VRFPAYPTYKPSGVEWLDEVPEHWDVKKLGYSARLQGGYAFASDNFDSEGVPVVRMNNLKRGVLDLSEASCIAPEKCLSSFALAKGDLLWGMSGSIGETGSLGNFARVRSSDVPAQLNQRVGRFSFVGEISTPNFLSYVIQTKLFYDQILLRATGTAQFNVSSEQVQSVTLPLPPAVEQRLIAAFLDRETGQVDRLVVKKRELIERLREKGTALISRAVTRGLPPTVARAARLPKDLPLRPSGVDWLGDMLAHWELVPLGYLVRFSGGATPDKSNSAYWDGSIPWVSPKDMKVARIADSEDHVSPEALDDSALRLIPVDSVLIVVRGMILAHSFPVARTTAPVTINQDMKAVACGKRVTAHFLSWSFIGFAKTFVSFTNESAHGTRKLETRTLTRFPFLLPPLPEQAAIAAYLDAETAKLDALVDKVEEAVERLQEYRTALITAAVTGKIDVRKAVTR
jgi:type I restriction enzyme S subunit